MNQIKVFSPASVSNVCCGFDVLGFSIEGIGDDIFIQKSNSKGIKILNMNDAKILNLSLAHLLSITGKPNYVLRSHSSANDRCCHRDLDGNLPQTKIDKRKFSVNCIRYKITSPPSFVSLEIVSTIFPVLSWEVSTYGDLSKSDNIFLVQSFLRFTERYILLYCKKIVVKKLIDKIIITNKPNS